MKNLHNAYKKHMENQMSEENFNELKSRILCASRQARVQQSTAAPAAAHKNRPVYGHPALRRVTACVCALAVVCGAVLVSGMQNGSMPVQPSAAGTIAASHTNGNWFCLAVYAAGSDTKTVQAAGAKAIKNFDFYSQENIVEFGKHRAITDFVFSMKCDGKNIRELKYEISGKPTFAISGNPKREGYPYNPYDYLPKEKTFTSFTAKPGDDLSKYRIHCVAEITPEEDALLKSIKDGIRYTRKEAEEIKARANAGEDTSSELGPDRTIQDVKINNVLDGTIISITAVFQDGTTQKARYQLNAAKDYLDKIRAWQVGGHQIEKKYEKASANFSTKEGAPKTKEQIEMEQECEKLDSRTLDKLYYITELK